MYAVTVVNGQPQVMEYDEFPSSKPSLEQLRKTFGMTNFNDKKDGVKYLTTSLKDAEAKVVILAQKKGAVVKV